MNWDVGCVQTAEWFAHHGNMDEACRTYESLLLEFPRAYAAQYRLAVLLRDRGMIDGAIRHYRQSIAVNPSYPFPRVDLGLLLINQGRFGEAEEQLHAALTLAEQQHTPSTLSGSAYYGLAAIALNRGDLTTASAMCDNALRIVPQYQAALALRTHLTALNPHR